MKQSACSIFGPAAIAAHFDDLGVEPRDDFNQVGLLGDHFANVFVRAGHFVGAGGEHANALALQVDFHGLPSELCFGLGARGCSQRGNGFLRGFSVAGC